VLHFEEGGSFRAWLKDLKRAPQQAELDKMIAPLLDALEIIHDADFLHRDIAPDNIMVRKDGSPVLIDFGSARGALASQSRTVSALVKPGYSPYEQYATSGSNQGPWTDIYALGATLYHAITGKRPPDAPSRVVNDEYVPAQKAAYGTYRSTFLDAIDQALRIEVGQRPPRIADWRGTLLAPEPKRKKGRAAASPLPTPGGLLGRLRAAGEPAATNGAPTQPAPADAAAPAEVPASLVPAPPDTPQPKGRLLDFIEGLRKRSAAPAPRPPEPDAPPGPRPAPAEPAQPAAVEPLPAAQEALPPPPAVLRRPRARQRSGWGRSARRWGKGLFRVAIACSVSALAVAHEQRVRLSSAGAPGASSSRATTAAPAMLLPGHRGPVVAVASSLEDQWIVSAGADATVRVWSAGSGGLVRTIDLAEGPATALAVAGRRALIGHEGGAVVLWDLDDATRLAAFRQGGAAVTAVAFLGDRLVVARRDGGVELHDPGAPDTPAVMLGGNESAGHLIAATRVRALLVTAGSDRTVRLWRGPEPRLIRTWRLTADSAAVDIASDASYVAGGSIDGVVRFQRSPGPRLPGAPGVQTLKAHAGRITAIALGPSGLLASAGEDGSLKLWTLHPQRTMRSLDGGQVQSLSFSRDGRRLLAGGRDGVIRVWSVKMPPLSGAT
jgi:hypothetical protein